jgi:hypothetical protein
VRQTLLNKQPLFYADQQLAQPTEATSHPSSRWRWLWLIVVIVTFFLGYAVGHFTTNKGTSSSQQGTSSSQQGTSSSQQGTSSSQQGATSPSGVVNSVQQGTSSSQQGATSPSGVVNSVQSGVNSVRTWNTLFSYHGIGDQQTQVFTAPKTWQLQWQCNPDSYITKQYNLVVTIYNADGTIAAPAAMNTLCKVGNTSDVLAENQGGKIYLDVFSQADWTLNVQGL